MTTLWNMNRIIWLSSCCLCTFLTLDYMFLRDSAATSLEFITTEMCRVGVLVLLLTSGVILANYVIDLFLSFLICKRSIITVIVTITCFNICRVLRIVIWAKKKGAQLMFLPLLSLVILRHLPVLLQSHQPFRCLRTGFYHLLIIDTCFLSHIS